MKIIGLTIYGFHFGRKRKKKVTSKLDRIANVALLEAAVKNPEVLTQVVNKYGKIQVPHDDTTAAEVANFREKIYKEAAQTILTTRRRDLVSYIDELIDTVMGLNSVPGRHQHEEGSFKSITFNGQNGVPNTIRQHRGMQQSRKTSPNPSVLIRGLAMLAVLEGIVNQQRKRQNRDSLEE